MISMGKIILQGFGFFKLFFQKMQKNKPPQLLFVERFLKRRYRKYEVSLESVKAGFL